MCAKGEILRAQLASREYRRARLHLSRVHPDVIAVPLGLGHTEFGDYAKGRGVNALDLLGRDGREGIPPVSRHQSHG